MSGFFVGKVFSKLQDAKYVGKANRIKGRIFALKRKGNMIIDYKPKFDEFKKTMEGLFVSRGYKLEMRYGIDRRRLHRCEMKISGSSKKVPDAYSMIRFQIDTMTIIYASGNVAICNWLADKYFKRPWYNMFDLMTASYQ